MIKFDLFIGLNDKDKKRQLRTLKECKEVINNVLIDNNIDYYTLIDCNGCYMKEVEKTIDCMIIVNDELEKTTTEKIKKSINELKKQLNQDSIMLKKERTDCLFL